MMTDDMELVRAYARCKSDEAFAALVSRHVNLVYSVALRSVRDAHLAEETTQVVFIILARKADSLGDKTILPGWLCRTARYASANALTIQRRRQRREQEAHRQSILNEAEPVPEETWNQIAPLLDGAMEQLGRKDHDALVLRFFEGKSYQEIGIASGASENAARKRVNYALEKLRRFFFKHGFSSTAAIIAAAISTNSVQAAPVTLAKMVTTVAIAKGAVAGGSTLTLIKGALKIMTWTKTQTIIVGTIVVGLTAMSVIQRQTQTKLRAKNESLSHQIVQLQNDNENLSKRVAQAERLAHLSTPPTKFVVPPATPPTEATSNGLQSSNLIAQLLKDGKAPTLTHEQVEAYLKANGRNAANLIAAFQASGNPALLQEAMEKYPNDPQVDFMAALDKDLSPEQQRQWLNAFEQSAPGNALANYLSALNYFSSGQNDQAVQELNAAAGKSQFQDYSLDSWQSMEEAYLASGYSIADAGVIAGAQLQLPQFNALKQLGQNMVSLANSYQQAGDSTSAQAALQMAVNLGQSLDQSGPPFLMNSLVAMNLEYNAFKTMDPNSPYGSDGQTVQDQLNQLTQQKTTLESFNDQFYNSVAPTMSDQDWINFEQREFLFGESAAEQWAISKHGQQ
jgi:RNA polymerase sigma factor (sigma-70 family)